MLHLTTFAIPTRFDAYEIHGVTEYKESGNKWCEQVPDHQASFWSLYGHVKGEGLFCIDDFKTREDAEEIFTRITGQTYLHGAIA